MTRKYTREKHPDIRITDKNMFLLDHITLKHCWVVAKEMSSEVAILNSCYNDATGFNGYKWTTICGATVFEERRRSLRDAVELILSDQAGTSWKIYLIFSTRHLLDFLGKWIIRRDNVLGDLGLYPSRWNGKVPESEDFFEKDLDNNT